MKVICDRWPKCYQTKTYMIRFFLKAKHLQLFALVLGIPLICQFYFTSQILGFQTQPEQVTDEEGFTQVLNEEFIQLDFFFPFLMIFFSLFIFGWFWSIAIGLQKKIPKGIEMKVKKFKILFFFPLVYIVLLMGYLAGLFNGMGTPNFLVDGWFIAIILPLHLFSMFCIFYSIYFSARTIKTAELERKVGLTDFIGEFFLLWFYFLGIWIIQPKVNKLYGK